MSTPTQDDDLLAILLTNLRNAAATFGEGSPPHETIRTIVDEHLQGMKARGVKTNLSAIAGVSPSSSQSKTLSRTGSRRGGEQQQQQQQLVVNFENLALRPKPSS